MDLAERAAVLMKAEAKVRNGENGDEELNRIRARVFLYRLWYWLIALKED